MRKILLLLTMLAMCAAAQAGITQFNCTFPDAQPHSWSFDYDAQELSLTETYVVGPGQTDSVNMFATADGDPIVKIGKYVTNGNGHAWTGYTLTLNGATPGVKFVAPASSDVFTIINVTDTLITYSGGIVAVGTDVELKFSVLVPDAGDFSWCVTQQAIPEPATLSLLGLGVLALFRKK